MRAACATRSRTASFCLPPLVVATGSFVGVAVVVVMLGLLFVGCRFALDKRRVIRTGVRRGRSVAPRGGRGRPPPRCLRRRRPRRRRRAGGGAGGRRRRGWTVRG